MKPFLKWLKRISLGVSGLALVLFLVLWTIFYFWRQQSIDALPGNSRVVETSMGPVEYQVQGDIDNYILLVHGTPGSYRTFGITPLLESGYSVVSPSRPGYFRTPLPVGESPAEQADSFAALLDTLQIDSVAVIGISGGGPSSLQFALRHPEKCSRLILMATPSQRIDRESQNLIQKLFSTEFGRWLSMKIMLTQVEDSDLAYRAEQYVQSTVFPLSETQKGIGNDQRQFNDLPDYPLEQIRTPTLVIHGEEDTRLSEHAENSATRIQNARLLTMEDKGHFDVVFFDVETTFVKAIEFLNEH